MANRAFKVLVSDKLAEEGLEILRQAPGFQVDVKVGLPPEELKQIIGEYDGLAIRSGTKVKADIIQAATKMRCIGRAGIGVDNVDIKAATERGILVMNTPEGNVVTTAEHAISLLCSMARKIPQATASMNAGKWEKPKFKGRELFRKTLGIIGLGNIGQVVANRALGLKMRVIAHDPYVTKERASELGVELVDLDALLTRADFITLHVPVADSTRGMISRGAIEKMKRGAFLINAARGGLVDEQAVADAVKSGKLGGAAFDVYEKEPPGPDHPLIGLDNVVLTPHLGASTTEAQVNVAVSVAEQIVDFLANGAIRNSINAPAVSRELMDTVGPYLRLGEKIGAMAGQIHRGGVREVRVIYAGAAADLPAEPVNAAVITGLLSSTLGDEVNPVSAPFVAKERGIAIVEERTSTARHFAAALTVRISGDEGSTEIVGTRFGTDERIVGVNGFRLEIVPEGHMLLMDLSDRPGMIGRIGTLLGEQSVNISNLNLGRKPESALAEGVLTVDGPVDEKTLKAISEIDGIESVRLLRLG